jgi:hypothetical protein
MKAPFAGVFRSLRGFNYRAWVAGALVSNVGTWVQRTAQDWLVHPAYPSRRFRRRLGHDLPCLGLSLRTSAIGYAQLFEIGDQPRPGRIPAQFLPRLFA